MNGKTIVLGLLVVVGLIVAAVYAIPALTTSPEEVPAERRGAFLVEEYFPCRSCHQVNNPLRAPMLEGLFRREVTLADGIKVIADAAYLRRALVQPAAEVSQGYSNIMPSYEDQVSATDIDLMVQYLKGL